MRFCKQHLVMVLTGLAPLGVSASADTLGSAISTGADVNLTSYTNVYDPAGGGSSFSSAGDGFGLFQVGTSASIPFALVDESAVGYPADTVGVISEFDTAPFFGTTDTVNGDTTSTVEAFWTFDIGAVTGPIQIGVDVVAMGDFESVDVFEFAYSFDGSTFTPFLESAFIDTGDEEGTDPAVPTGLAGQDYTLGSGSTVTYDDPMTLGGATLTNVLTSLSSGDVTATSETLTVRFSALTDGGSEALAFRNLEVTGTPVPEPASLALLALGGVTMLGRRRRTA